MSQNDARCHRESDACDRDAVACRVVVGGVVDQLVIEYQANFAGQSPRVGGGYHLHIYGGDGTNPADRVMGSQAGGSAGRWYVEDKNPSRVSTTMDQYQVVGNKPKVCARIANNKHALVADNSGNGTYKTGNCFPVTSV